MMLNKDMFSEEEAGSDYRVPLSIAQQVHQDFFKVPCSSITGLARLYQIPVDAVCNIIAGAEGVPLPQAVLLMRESGYQTGDIALHLGVSARTVQRIFANE